MELRHLRYFVALAECLSFTRAAERVHVTQSTLSHQIRQLEDELGQPLFDRIGKRVMLTEAGETYLGYASRAPQAPSTSASCPNAWLCSSSATRQ
jgi:LysR family cyn operon transcriptional activator